MMISRHCQCLIVTLVMGIISFKEVSAGLGVADVIRSKNESLRDPGIYIIHFEENATETQLQTFVKQLITTSKKRAKEGFKVEIITEYFGINFLTARLSEKALHWVRIKFGIHCTTYDQYNIVCTLTSITIYIFALCKK